MARDLHPQTADPDKAVTPERVVAAIGCAAAAAHLYAFLEPPRGEDEAHARVGLWLFLHDASASPDDPGMLLRVLQTGYDCTAAVSPVAALTALAVVHGTSAALGLHAGIPADQMEDSARKACRYAAAALNLADAHGALDVSAVALRDALKACCGHRPIRGAHAASFSPSLRLKRWTAKTGRQTTTRTVTPASTPTTQPHAQTVAEGQTPTQAAEATSCCAPTRD